MPIRDNFVDTPFIRTQKMLCFEFLNEKYRTNHLGNRCRLHERK